MKKPSLRKITGGLFIAVPIGLAFGFIFVKAPEVLPVIGLAILFVASLVCGILLMNP